MFHYGLSVHTKYRGRGIGEYILRARIPLGKAIGVSLTSGGFSAIASQKLAARAGFECNIEMTYVFVMYHPQNWYITFTSGSYIGMMTSQK